MMTLLLLVIAFAQSAATPQQPVSIFVGPNVRDGFVDVDQGILESIRDVSEELRRSRRFLVVPSKDAATIVLLVVGRRISGSAGAVGLTSPGTTYGGGTIAGVAQPATTTPGITTTVMINRHAIDTLLRVGTYEKPITSEDENAGSWRGVAKRVLKDVLAWVDANQQAITAKR